MTNLDSILKSRDITLPKKVCLVKAMVFPVVTYGCESWTVKKAECQRIDAFELWCWRRLLRVPWTARRFNQSILKEISPGSSLEGLMLKLKLLYFAPSCEELTHWKRLWCWEGLGAGGEGDDRGWDGWMASPTPWTWVWVNSGSWWWTGRPGVLWFMGSQRVRHDWATELNWTETLLHNMRAFKNPIYQAAPRINYIRISGTKAPLFKVSEMIPLHMQVWKLMFWNVYQPSNFWIKIVELQDWSKSFNVLWSGKKLRCY